LIRIEPMFLHISSEVGGMVVDCTGGAKRIWIM
jgi:hypothetical protein